MRRQGVLWPMALWVATGMHKVSMLAFVVVLGRIAGALGLGVHASLAAACGLVGALAHLGLPDWSMYRAAEKRAQRQPLDARTGSAHGLFLSTATVAYAGIGLCLPWWVESPSARLFGWWVLLGLYLPHLGYFTLATLRGLGEPRLESLSLAASALTLGAACVWASSLEQLGLGLVVSGAWLLLPLLWSFTQPGLRPRWGGLGAALKLPLQSVPYVLLGQLHTLLWSAPVLLTRLYGNNVEVGVLQAGVMVLHGGLFGSWLFGTLLIHRIREGSAPARWLAAVLGLALAALGVGLSWLLHPFLFRHFGLDPETTGPVLGVASMVSPFFYVATLWMPIATGLAPARVRLALLSGVLATMCVGFILRQAGPVGALWALWAGLVPFLGLTAPVVFARRSPAAQGSFFSL